MRISAAIQIEQEKILFDSNIGAYEGYMMMQKLQGLKENAFKTEQEKDSKKPFGWLTAGRVLVVGLGATVSAVCAMTLKIWIW